MIPANKTVGMASLASHQQFPHIATPSGALNAGLTPAESPMRGTSRWTIDAANALDEPALRKLSREVTLPGAFRVAFAREPDFFASLNVEGREHRVIVARRRDTEEPVGFGVISTKPVWIGGEPRLLAYLSGLRLRPEWRGGAILAAGYRRAFADDISRADVMLTTVLESNEPMRRLVERLRPALPVVYEPLGRFLCRAAPVGRAAPPTGDEIVPARCEDVPALFEFLERAGPLWQFFPRYAPEDLADGGLLQGLRPEDILLLRAGGRIRGCMALWDQRAFRQMIVEHYPRWLRMARPLLAALPRRLGLPRLPQPGETARIAYAALACAEAPDSDVFDRLFRAVRARAAGRFDFVIIGAHESHPMAEAVRRTNGIPFDSRLYRVRPRVAAETPPPALNARTIYLETGAL